MSRLEYVKASVDANKAQRCGGHVATQIRRHFFPRVLGSGAGSRRPRRHLRFHRIRAVEFAVAQEQ
jgi:hypothetical protein